MSDAPSASDPLAALSSEAATLRPWKVWWFGHQPEPAPGEAYIDGDDEMTVASELDHADAKLIVACVNAFAALDAPVIDRIRAAGGLAAYVRDLEGARERAEGVAASALARLDADGRAYAQIALDANAATMVAENRVTVLEAALQRLAGHHHAVTHPGRYETCPTSICREAREALSPPGPTQLAPAAEPAGGDAEPLGGA